MAAHDNARETVPGIQKAVVLARGLGKRMRENNSNLALETAQDQAASAGTKAMIPVGRPFLDYILSSLADAGFADVCLVIGPEHGEIREYYTRTSPPRRLKIAFAIQEKPLGTANAVAAAESFAGGEVFLAINSDNYYPQEALRALRALGRPGAAVFERATLQRKSNIAAQRVSQFAIVEMNAQDELRRIHEKPDAALLAAMGLECYVSMNCWALGPSIFRSCAAIAPSPRGELELTAAVQHSIDLLEQRYLALKFRSGVLDLSTRADIPAVAERLRNVPVHL